ncbi:MAG: ISL3 family transposase, partial [Proteobacteria bacterium]|nr:ISL3 family transposase [Pseudomonadota bacterium]
CIIGLPGVELENAISLESIEVYATTSLRPPCIHCGGAKTRIKSSFTRRLNHTRQGNRLMVLFIRSRKFLCLLCKKYFNLRIPGVLPRKRSTESFRQEVYEKHHGGISQQFLSRTHGIGAATVERWYQDFTLYRVKELQGRPAPRVLGIDEHFFTRKDGFATTFCDLTKHKIYDVILGRSEKSLEKPLALVSEKSRTRLAVIDLSENYRQIIKKHFPNALIVADRFHVIRLINHHFLKAWQLMDSTGRKNRGLLSLMRRHERNLKTDQRSKLQSYLANYPTLLELYDIKQRLCILLGINTKKKFLLRVMIREFLSIINQLKETGMDSIRTLGETLDKWKEEIARMIRFSNSNGITEGFHTKMEMISRRAFGFRNFENYRRRVLAHCGWDGVFAIRN